MFKHILVPLDGSGRAERALPVAAHMARASGSSILLVRVVNTEPASLPSAPGRPNLVQTVGETDRTLAESYLEGWANSDLLRDLSVQIRVPVGLIPPSIITVATENHADIIVMCSHGYTGVKHWWMLGSVAAKIARFTQIPVMILREGGPVPKERHAGERPLRILVPLDGSDYARAALVPAAYLAAALATPGQGALHLTHVVQPAHEGRGLTRTARGTARSAQSTQTSLNMATEYLKATIQQLRDGSLDKGITDLGLEFTFSVTADDDIAQNIIRIAENGGDGDEGEVFGGCDVIAMTTQGYSGPQPWVGSVTERILETSRLPLLCVRPPV